ncbi:MAG: DUF5683 domain-containing protein [Balneolaceae bacterium]
MRTLAIIFFLLGCNGGLVNAQPVKGLTGGIFKVEEKAPSNQPLHISDFRYQQDLSPNSFLNLPRTNPGAAFLSSAIIPGSGQAMNGKWVRAGIYFTAEVVGLIYHLDRNAKARRQEKSYEQFTHQNWSVMAYSQWLVQYSDANNLNQEKLGELRSQSFDDNGNPYSPNWGNTHADWNEIDISTLHDVENQTPFIFENHYGSEFSHELPQYGSQQYYELISKYYQYQPGWQDWYGEITTNPNQSTDLYRYMWNGQDQPFDMFYQGRNLAEEFNDNYRVAGNILKLLLVNHVVSAFDALFTVQLKNSRIETDTNLLKLEQFSVSWHF